MTGFRGASIDEGDLQRVDDCDVKGSVLSVRPSAHVDIGWAGIGARQKVRNFSGGSAVCGCGHFVGGVSKLIMARDSLATHGAGDGMVAHNVIRTAACNTVPRGIEKWKAKAIKRGDAKLLGFEMKLKLFDWCGIEPISGILQTQRLDSRDFAIVVQPGDKPSLSVEVNGI